MLDGLTKLIDNGQNLNGELKFIHKFPHAPTKT